MTEKVFSVPQAAKQIKTLQQKGKRIVVVGGCFDLLHIGHVTLLQKAKAKGDILVVMLESDEKIRQTKGLHRPIHTQKQRAKMLAALSCIDMIIPLRYMASNKQYDTIVAKLSPNIIATTQGDTGAVHKKRQAKKCGAKLLYVTNHIKSFSSTKLVEALLKE